MGFFLLVGGFQFFQMGCLIVVLKYVAVVVWSCGRVFALETLLRVFVVCFFCPLSIKFGWSSHGHCIRLHLVQTKLAVVTAFVSNSQNISKARPLPWRQALLWVKYATIVLKHATFSSERWHTSWLQPCSQVLKPAIRPIPFKAPVDPPAGCFALSQLRPAK